MILFRSRNGRGLPGFPGSTNYRLHNVREWQEAFQVLQDVRRTTAVVKGYDLRLLWITTS